MPSPRPAATCMRAALSIPRAAVQRWPGTLVQSIARVRLAQGQLPQALELLEQALALRRAAGDLDGEGYTLFYLGEVHGLLGDTAEAIDLFEQTLPIRKAHRDELGRIESWN